MKNFCVQFCGALKAFRAKAGKGQIAFAKELGLSQPVYARYEKGDREPTLNELIRIAQILHTTPNVLLGFEPPPLRASAPPREINTGDNSPVAIGSHNTIINAGGGCVIIIINQDKKERHKMTPKKFIVRRPPLNPQFAARRLSDDIEEDANHGCLCFALGVLFGPLGLLLAAIVGKAKGLVAALWGFLISWLVFGLVLWCLIFARH